MFGTKVQVLLLLSLTAVIAQIADDYIILIKDTVKSFFLTESVHVLFNTCWDAQ